MVLKLATFVDQTEAHLRKSTLSSSSLSELRTPKNQQGGGGLL
jgi:hypothetical protein